MTKKNESLLGLPQVTFDTGSEISGSIIPLNEGYLPASYKRQMYAEAIKQKMAIDATRFKALYAIVRLREINQHTATEFDKAAEFISKVNLRTQGNVHQHYTSEFCHYLTQVTAQEIAGIARVGCNIIAQVVAQSPYPEPEEEEKRGFFARLFGG